MRKMKQTEKANVKAFLRDEVRTNLKNQLLESAVPGSMLCKALEAYDFDSIAVSISFSSKEIFVKANIFDGLLKMDILMSIDTILTAYIAKQSTDSN